MALILILIYRNYIFLELSEKIKSLRKKKNKRKEKKSAKL